MARGFGATDGAGSTDAIVLAFTTALPVLTLHIWFTRRSLGGGGLGRLCQKATTGDTGPKLFNADAGPPSHLNFLYPWSGSGGGTAGWQIDAPAVSATTWHALTLTYDESSTSNDPAFWLDGASQTVTELTAPSGTPNQGSEAWVLGNRKSDSARAWDGNLAEFAIWNRILSNSEITALAAGFAPAWSPRGLVAYTPMVRAAHDYRNAVTTLTGTAVQTHPRVIYPRWFQQALNLASAAATFTGHGPLLAGQRNRLVRAA